MKVGRRFYWTYFKFLIVLTILSIIVCWWGWHVSKPSDGMPFARSGAVATAILITFLVSNYTETLTQVRCDIMTAFENSGNWTSASENVRKQLDDDIKKLTDYTQAIIRYWYATLMFLVTMVWGIGDRFYVLVLSNPALTICEIAGKLSSLASQ